MTENQDFLEILKASEMMDLYQIISEDKSKFRCTGGKCSIKQILGHITDHERIMMYRTLRASRGDETALSGYDQDKMVNGARFDELAWVD